MFTKPDPDLKRAARSWSTARPGRVIIPAAIGGHVTHRFPQPRGDACVSAKCLIGAVLEASPGRNTPERGTPGACGRFLRCLCLSCIAYDHLLPSPVHPLLHLTPNGSLYARMRRSVEITPPAWNIGTDKVTAPRVRRLLLAHTDGLRSHTQTW